MGLEVPQPPEDGGPTVPAIAAPPASLAAPSSAAPPPGAAAAAAAPASRLRKNALVGCPGRGRGLGSGLARFLVIYFLSSSSNAFSSPL